MKQIEDHTITEQRREGFLLGILAALCGAAFIAGMCFLKEHTGYPGNELLAGVGLFGLMAVTTITTVAGLIPHNKQAEDEPGTH